MLNDIFNLYYFNLNLLFYLYPYFYIKNKINFFYFGILIILILTRIYVIEQLLFINILILFIEFVKYIGIKKIKINNIYFLCLFIYIFFNEYYSKIDFYMIDLIKIIIIVPLIYLINRCIILLEKNIKLFFNVVINKYFR